ncbi:MAG: hypothetical protein DRH32_03700 [Deltaproteobacteria bacterium]|nr:MAG: hypothetical protein DRH32_03700 [Deltaproteobacteria bacterium]
MNFCSHFSNNEKTGPENQNFSDQFYSVEFLSPEIQVLYQFKLWNSEAEPLFVLVREESDIIGCLKTGNVFRMKYYGTDSGCPTKYLPTQIENITKEDKGRFKGHYLVSLSILPSANETIH